MTRPDVPDGVYTRFLKEACEDLVTYFKTLFLKIVQKGIFQLHGNMQELK